MTYRRVLPRDLFNEADLLKCYGKLWLELDRMANGSRFEEEDVERFEIAQNQDDGSLTISNLTFTVPRGRERLTVALFRPLNARTPWPLYAEFGGHEVGVFDEDGTLSREFLIGLTPF